MPQITVTKEQSYNLYSPLYIYSIVHDRERDQIIINFREGGNEESALPAEEGQMSCIQQPVIVNLADFNLSHGAGRIFEKIFNALTIDHDPSENGFHFHDIQATEFVTVCPVGASTRTKKFVTFDTTDD